MIGIGRIKETEYLNPRIDEGLSVIESVKRDEMFLNRVIEELEPDMEVSSVEFKLMLIKLWKEDHEEKYLNALAAWDRKYLRKNMAK